VRWARLREEDGERLEHAIACRSAKTVPVACGRYDVHLQQRTLKAAYWNEAPRKVMHSSWFYGEEGNRLPYSEEEAEDLEKAFLRLRSRKQPPQLLVPVNKGRHDVRFEKWENDRQQGSWFSPQPSLPSRTNSAFTQKRPLEDEEDLDEEDICQLTAQQESVDRSGGQQCVPVVRGNCTYSYFEGGEAPSEEHLLPARVECLVFVVHGIGQYHRARDPKQRFHRDVGKVRSLAVKSLRQRMKEDLPVKGRIEFLPLEWYESVHIDARIGTRLENVTLPSVSELRKFANFAIADIIVYQNDELQRRIHDALMRKMDKLWLLFCERNPEFSGKVAVIGHSLGAVIMFDLVQKLTQALPEGLNLDHSDDVDAASNSPAGQYCLDESTEASIEAPPAAASHSPVGHNFLDASTEASEALPGSGDPSRFPELCPAPRCFFAVGAPLGMFLSIRLARQRRNLEKYFHGLDVRCPESLKGRGWRFFNVFHPDDPIAYRVEPLLNPFYTQVPPKVIPHLGGLRWNSQVREWYFKLTRRNETEEDSTDVLQFYAVDDFCAHDFLSDKPGKPRQVIAVDRLDYVIQASVLEQLNEYVNAIRSHTQYWDNEDMVSFIVDQVFKCIDELEPSSSRNYEHTGTLFEKQD